MSPYKNEFLLTQIQCTPRISLIKIFQTIKHEYCLTNKLANILNRCRFKERPAIVKFNTFPQNKDKRGMSKMIDCLTRLSLLWCFCVWEFKNLFLAHLSRRLEWAIVIAHRPSSVRKLFTFSTSSPKPLDKFWWNLVGMKYSWSLTSVVVFRPDPPRGGSRAGPK